MARAATLLAAFLLSSGPHLKLETNQRHIVRSVGINSQVLVLDLLKHPVKLGHVLLPAGVVNVEQLDEAPGSSVSLPLLVLRSILILDSASSDNSILAMNDISDQANSPLAAQLSLSLLEVYNVSDLDGSLGVEPLGQTSLKYFSDRQPN